MTLTESSIYIGLKKLGDKLYSIKYLMDKSDRILMAETIFDIHAQVMIHYSNAFLDPISRKDELKKAIGYFAVLRDRIDFCVRHKIIHFTNTRGAYDDWTKLTKVELYEIIAQIDNDMLKWYGSLNKSQTIIA